MIEVKETQSRFRNYLLLNGSFADNIGICSGKSALALYFYYLKGNSDDSYSFLEEIISQINAVTPLSYGNGIAGFGIVLEHLIQEGMLDENANDILEECDQRIAGIVYTDVVDDISISNGVSGIGLYLLHRLKTSIPHNNTVFFNHRLIDGITRCIFRIERMIINYRLGYSEVSMDTNIWSNSAGALLFLAAARSAMIPEPRIELITEEILRFIYTRLQPLRFCWNQIDTWYAVMYAAHRLADRGLYHDIISSFKKKLQSAASEIEKLDLYKGSFTSLLLMLIYKEHNLVPAMHLSDSIRRKIESILNCNSLADLFPYQDHLQSVPIGLEAGVCGMALPLWSLQYSSYKWLSVLGIEK